MKLREAEETVKASRLVTWKGARGQGAHSLTPPIRARLPARGGKTTVAVTGTGLLSLTPVLRVSQRAIKK